MISRCQALTSLSGLCSLPWLTSRLQNQSTGWGALEDAVALDIVDYAQQRVNLYMSITGSQKLRHAPTPICLVPSDDDVKGELAPNACKILMKALWLGRLARPEGLGYPSTEMVEE